MAEDEAREPLLTDDVRELLRLISEGDIAEVLIKRGNAKVHIKRASPPHVLNMVAGTPPAAAIPAGTFLPQPVSATPAATPEESTSTSTDVTITAPMVGTFYRAPAPKDPPYVDVGDEVRPGDVLGIIEAMKIMNEIECEVQGRVTEILAESGQAAEYGQALMIIEPT